MHEKRSRGSEEPRGYLITTRADSAFERSARTARSGHPSATHATRASATSARPPGRPSPSKERGRHSLKRRSTARTVAPAPWEAWRKTWKKRETLGHLGLDHALSSNKWEIQKLSSAPTTNAPIILCLVSTQRVSTLYANGTRTADTGTVKGLRTVIPGSRLQRHRAVDYGRRARRCYRSWQEQRSWSAKRQRTRNYRWW